jgi:tetratricopeptide (TPR) repeat protein
MKKLFLILLFLSSLIFANPNSNPPFYTESDLFNVCLDHFESYPESIFNHDINFNQQAITNGRYSNKLALRQKQLIKKHNLNLSLIPLSDHTCTFTFCKSCQKPVLKGIGFADEDDYSFDDAPLEFLKCDCLKKWTDIWKLEDMDAEYSLQYIFDDDYENYVKPTRDWHNCSSESVYASLLAIDTDSQATFFKDHLQYLEQNHSCDCYWQFKNPLAEKIGTKVYKSFIKFLENSFLRNTDDLDAVYKKLPQFKKLSTFDIAIHEFTHAVFYSQYREKLLTFGLWDENFNEDNNKVIQNLNRLYKLIDEIGPDFYRLYTQCLNSHPHPKIYFERGMTSFYQGDYLDALDDIKTFIQTTPSDDKTINAEVYFKEGSIYAELGLYEKAVEALNQAIHKDPQHKEAYLERAACYFEMGQFDSCIEDYLKSGIKQSNDQVLSENNYQFSLGLTQGILKGGAHAGLDYIPSLLSSTYGIGQGLWAFSQSPLQASLEFIQSVKGLIVFIQETTALDLLKELAPELKIVIEQWDTLDEQTKGYQIGTVIGKYGIEIFAGSSLSKGIAYYKQLKRANNLLLYESMALNKEVKEIIKIEALKRADARKSILKSSNLKIQWDKQGKHIEGHRNFMPTKSILEHKDPQRLVNKYAGSGISVRGTPGVPGYQEIVNFEEFIGYAVSEDGAKKVSTTWGTIHYAKDGVHIVPKNPKVL